MRNLLYLFVLLGIFSSCKNVQKMVDQGKYDEAILYSLEKMEGEKYREKKYVIALEDAFQKVTKREMDKWNYYKNSGNSSDWPKAYRLIKKIESRQERVSAYLPLISKEGYRAEFNFVKTAGLIAEARDNSAAYHYDHGSELLKVAISDRNSDYGKKAYTQFGAIKKYFDNYKDANEKIKIAKEIGIVDIMLIAEDNSQAFLPSGFMHQMLNFRDVPSNQRWTRYHTEWNDAIDMVGTLDIRFINVSPERESVETHFDSKEIKHGFTYALDKNGNVKKDSLGNDIKIPNYKTVTAKTKVLFREKHTVVEAEFRLKDLRSNQIIDREPIKAESSFENFSIKRKGDHRAVCDHKIHNYETHPLPFPHDGDMIGEAITQIKAASLSRLEQMVN